MLAVSLPDELVPPSQFRWPGGRTGKLYDHLLSAWSVRRPDGCVHAERIARYTNVLAHALGHSSEEAATLAELAALHDIGELALPDLVLQCNGELNPDELAMKRRHVSFGAELLTGVQCSFSGIAANIARHHHERWNGRGYPDGLVGEACPREARIVGIVDAYDTLCHPHHGRTGLTDAELSQYFRSERGTRFDPALVDALLATLGEFRIISSPRQSNAEAS